MQVSVNNNKKTPYDYSHLLQEKNDNPHKINFILTYLFIKENIHIPGSFCTVASINTRYNLESNYASM